MNSETSYQEQLFAEFFFGVALTVSLTFILFSLFLPVTAGLSRVLRRKRVYRELGRTRDNYLALRKEDNPPDSP